MDYSGFLREKEVLRLPSGISGFDLNPALYPFQRDLTSWALSSGRSAIFAECGLGKTPMQLNWAEEVAKKEGKPVLIITPLAVSPQTIREGEKFGIECERSTNGSHNGARVIVTNYERLHYFNRDDFSGIVCDESSAIKNFAGKRQKQITEFMKRAKYRLLCTATAAPNDYIELGTSAEALGQMGRMDMLGTFFKNDENSLHPIWWGARWRFKAHAETPFWRWVCSWSRAVRKPSDMGYDDDDFVLPPLETIETIVKASRPRFGKLFIEAAVTLNEQREERNMTMVERCEAAAAAVDNDRPAVMWCHLNKEADMLEKMVPDAKQVAGRHSDDEKEGRLLDFSEGRLRVLVTKPKIGAFGLNWQHCSNMTFFPSHSFEQFYQGIRRCWRFGQKHTVTANVITTEGEMGVLKNLQRKEAAANKMFRQLIKEMNNVLKINADPDTHKMKAEVPPWL